MCQNILPFYDWLVFHYMDTPHFATFIHWWILGLRLFFRCFSPPLKKKMALIWWRKKIRSIFLYLVKPHEIAIFTGWSCQVSSNSHGSDIMEPNAVCSCSSFSTNCVNLTYSHSFSKPKYMCLTLCLMTTTPLKVGWMASLKLLLDSCSLWEGPTVASN